MSEPVGWIQWQRPRRRRRSANPWRLWLVAVVFVFGVGSAGFTLTSLFLFRTSPVSIPSVPTSDVVAHVVPVETPDAGLAPSGALDAGGPLDDGGSDPIPASVLSADHPRRPRGDGIKVGRKLEPPPPPPESPPPPPPEPPPPPPPPKVRPPEHLEALAIVAQVSALSRASDSDLRAQLKKLQALPARDPGVAIARDRCVGLFDHLASAVEAYAKLQVEMERRKQERVTKALADQLEKQLQPAEQQVELASTALTPCYRAAQAVLLAYPP